jgi:uncharacterized protein (DUF111 family)
MTPTGAALAVTLADSFGPPPTMTVRKIATGAGTREFPGMANVLRLFLGEAPATSSDLFAEDLVVIETNVDDMNPELLPPLMEELFAAGALDVWLTPIQMKKGRLATLVSALAEPACVESVIEALLRNSTSLGARIMPCGRRCLPREMAQVETPWGPVQVKLGRLGAEVVTAAPEYEDCARLAAEAGVPLKQVYAAALGEAQGLLQKPDPGDERCPATS